MTEAQDEIKIAKKFKKEAITWQSGPFYFCAPLELLDEMILCKSFVPIVNHGPSHCQGFSTVRGQVIHVLSSRWLFSQLGLTVPVEDSALGKNLIVFNEGKSRWGLVADRLGAVLELNSLASKQWAPSLLGDTKIAEWQGLSYFIVSPAEMVKRYE